MTTPNIAKILARCAAVLLFAYTLLRVFLTLNPQIPCALMTRNDVITPMSSLTITLLMIEYGMALPMLALAVYQMFTHKLTRSGSLIGVILFAVFFVMQLLADLMGSYIGTVTAVSNGVDALTTLSSVQTFIGFFSPVATIAYVLLGCSVAIVAYEGSLPDEEYEDEDEETDAE